MRNNNSNLIQGPYSKIEISDFNIGSIMDVKEYLLSQGWIPDVWNYSKDTRERTSPKLEGEFKGITGDLPKKIKQRITWRHRRSQIEGWLKNVRVYDNSIAAGANPCGTNTCRMRHYNIVNIPKANADAQGQLIWDVGEQYDIYGTQMRALFIPREGYVLVGHDASGLELRMLAHYMDDYEFIQEILNGDIHTYNQTKAGLPTRAAAKSFIYALIYGAGDATIGELVGGSKIEGRQIKQEYFSELPKLKRLIESVKRASGRGWLKGLDGRRIYMRNDSRGNIDRKKAVNTLLQSAGSIVMKKSCVKLWKEVERQGIQAHKVLDMHDEGQSEVKDNQENIERYCITSVNSIIDAGKHFNLNIPLDAEYKIGRNMAETH